MPCTPLVCPQVGSHNPTSRGREKEKSRAYTAARKLPTKQREGSLNFECLRSIGTVAPMFLSFGSMLGDTRTAFCRNEGLRYQNGPRNRVDKIAVTKSKEGSLLFVAVSSR